jgi:hypothetical protein
MEYWLNSKISLTQVVNIIYYCRLLFVIPYSVNPSCARLVENNNYVKLNQNIKRLESHSNSTTKTTTTTPTTKSSK